MTKDIDSAKNNLFIQMQRINKKMQKTDEVLEKVDLLMTLMPDFKKYHREINKNED